MTRNKLTEALDAIDKGESPFNEPPLDTPNMSEILLGLAADEPPLDTPIEPSVEKKPRGDWDRIARTVDRGIDGGDYTAEMSGRLNDQGKFVIDSFSTIPATDHDALEAELAAGVEKVVLPDTNPKTAMGVKKPGTAAIPPIVILELGAVMANGAAKYGRFNWREHEVTTSVYTDAIERHLLSYRDGETHDRESGLPHLAHVMASCAILLDAASVGRLNDDRSYGMAAQWIADATKA